MPEYLFMQQTSSLLQTLKKYLKSKGWTYKTLANKLGLSEPSIKRLFSEETISLNRLEQICNNLDISLFELVKLADKRATPTSVLSHQQETLLATDLNLLTIFYLVVNGWDHEGILNNFEISETKLSQLLLRLDKHKLIELHTNNRIKLFVSANIEWSRGGPIQNKFEKKALNEFLYSPFDGPNRFFSFNFYQLSKASIQLVQRKLMKLHREIHEITELDNTLPPKEKHDIGIILAIRPWLFSIFDQLSPKKQ